MNSIKLVFVFPGETLLSFCKAHAISPCRLIKLNRLTAWRTMRMVEVPRKSGELFEVSPRREPTKEERAYNGVQSVWPGLILERIEE
ncbi:MAG: hypothetical protein ACI4U2_03430 [Christensenellaceae bacterium]